MLLVYIQNSGLVIFREGNKDRLSLIKELFGSEARKQAACLFVDLLLVQTSYRKPAY